MPPSYESKVDGSFSESSPFVRLFGTPSRAKILDVFLRKHYEELTASDVITLAGISRNSFHRNVDELEELGVVEKTGSVGNSNTYQLNKDSELAKTLAGAHADILEHAKHVLDTTNHSVEKAIISAIKESTANEERSSKDTEDNERDGQVSREVTDAIAG